MCKPMTFNHGVLGSSPSALTKLDQAPRAKIQPFELRGLFGACTQCAHSPGAAKTAIDIVGWVLLAVVMVLTLGFAKKPPT